MKVFGKILSFEMRFTDSGDFKGRVYVTYEKYSSAEKALNTMHKKKLKDKTVKVKIVEEEEFENLDEFFEE